MNALLDGAVHQNQRRDMREVYLLAFEMIYLPLSSASGFIDTSFLYIVLEEFLAIS